MRSRDILITLLVVVPVLPASAAVKEEVAELQSENPWHGERSLGFNRSTGNSSLQNFLGKLRLYRKSSAWDLDMKAEAIVSADRERKTRETVITDVQAGYHFAEYGYSFANLRYTNDRFGPFTSQASLSAGIGWQVFDSERRKLALEGGVGVRHSEQRITENAQSETVLRGKLNWQYQLTESASLLNNVRMESGPDNTLLESETAMRLKVREDLGLKLSYRLRNNSTVPAGTRNTDGLTAISLDFLF